MWDMSHIALGMAPGTLPGEDTAETGGEKRHKLARAILYGTTQRTGQAFLPVSDHISPSICSVPICVLRPSQSSEGEAAIAEPGSMAEKALSWLSLLPDILLYKQTG